MITKEYAKFLLDPVNWNGNVCRDIMEYNLELCYAFRKALVGVARSGKEMKMELQDMRVILNETVARHIGGTIKPHERNDKCPQFKRCGLQEVHPEFGLRFVLCAFIPDYTAVILHKSCITIETFNWRMGYLFVNSRPNLIENATVTDGDQISP